MNKELEKKLVEKYPELFSGIKEPITQNLMAFGCECGDGWYWLINNLCDAIQNYLNSNAKINNIPQVKLLQVKEKFGGLRYYYGGGDDFVAGMVWLAEDMSYNICEQCGSTENVKQSIGNWIYTRCEKCMKKMEEERYGI